MVTKHGFHDRRVNIVNLPNVWNYDFWIRLWKVVFEQSHFQMAHFPQQLGQLSLAKKSFVLFKEKEFFSFLRAEYRSQRHAKLPNKKVVPREEML